MSEKINNLEVSMGQLKDSREKGMLDVVREKERLQEEVTKAMHKVRVSTIMITKFCEIHHVAMLKKCEAKRVP